MIKSNVLLPYQLIKYCEVFMLLHQIYEPSSLDFIALKSRNLSVTYRALDQSVQNYRSYFENIGIKPGEM